MMELRPLKRIIAGKQKVPAEIHMLRNLSFYKPANVSVPGLDKIAIAPSNASKLLWLLAICAFYGLCIYQLVDRVNLYFEHPLALDVNIIRNKSIEFPAITVCPYYGYSIPLSKLQTIRKRHSAAGVGNNFTSYNTSLEDIWKEFRMNKRDINLLSSCATPTRRRIDFRYKIALLDGCMDTITMSLRTLKTIFGTCVVVTPKDNFHYGGVRTFYQVYTKRQDLRIKKFMPHLRSFSVHELSNNEFDVFTGFEMEVRFQMKQDSIASSGFCIRLGKMRILWRSKKQPTIPASCEAEMGSLTDAIKDLLTDVINDLIPIRGLYNFLNTDGNSCTDFETAVICRKNCIENELLSVLECRLPFMNNSTLLPCQDFGASHIALKQVEQIYTMHAGCSCPRSCHETIFTFSSDLHRASPSMKSYSVFTLIYPDNTVEVITEKYAYPFSSLLSDIGGNLGFCVGLCLFSFVDILDYALQQIVFWTSNTKKRSPKKPATVHYKKKNKNPKNVVA